MFSRAHRKILTVAVTCVVCGAGLAAAVTANASSARPASTGKTVVVKLKNFMFNPMTVTVAPGTTIKWEWLDGPHGDHNITPLHKKGSLMFTGTGTKTKGSYSVKFTKKGIYYYECSIHPLSMQGKITVK